MLQRGPDLKLDEWKLPVLEFCTDGGYGTRDLRLQWPDDGDSFSGPSSGRTYGLFGYEYDPVFIFVVGTKVCVLTIRSVIY